MQPDTHLSARVCPSDQQPVTARVVSQGADTVARGFPPELLRLIDTDPRFRVQTWDGLDCHTGEAVELQRDMRTTALKRMANRIDWRSRELLGMDELNYVKAFFRTRSIDSQG